MNSIKSYKIIIAIVLTILILVLIRSVGPYHFKSDAIKWAEPSIMRSNIVSVEQLGSLPGNKLIICLDKDDEELFEFTKAVVNIPSGAILVRENLTEIRRHEGPVLIYSSEVQISARIWMVLSQMGFENIYLLTNDPQNEVLKYKFRPDTLVRPEL